MPPTQPAAKSIRVLRSSEDDHALSARRSHPYYVLKQCCSCVKEEQHAIRTPSVIGHCQGFSSSGSLAIFAAMRRASSFRHPN
jgi:hypothetical protein